MFRFHPFDVTTPHIVYACLGGFVVLFGMFSLFIRERLYIGEAIWAFLFGVVIGPYGAGIFDPRSWGNSDTENEITLELTRVVLAIGVFAIGVELPKAYMLKHWKSLAFLLVPVMTYGWFVSAALIYALIPKLNFLSSLAIAACLTPTDPILAAAVVGGKYAEKNVPAHLRHLLAAECGCNDGAAFPFLFLALYLTTNETVGDALAEWFLDLWLFQILLSIVYGSALGYGFRHLMKFCEGRALIDRQSYVAQYVSLALLVIGTATMLGTDDLLAAFCCGAAFAWDGFFNRQTKEALFSSVIDLLFNVACFVYIGAWTPFNDFNDPVLTVTVWRLVVIAILVLLLRRLPIMVALYRWIPDVKTFREAVFSGHFGPMGVGAVFISTLAYRKLPHAEEGTDPETQAELLAASIQPIVAFVVLCSILIHGLSIPFFSLGKRVHTVSRTWSRHSGGPDWTTLTRRVSKAEDIVINRDPRDAQDQLERGEVATIREKEDVSLAQTPTDAEKLEDGGESSGSGGKTGEREGSIVEWREGPHQVIERKTGSSGEVEVEVRRNVYAPENVERMTSRFAGGESEVKSAVGEYLRWLKADAHRTAQGLKEGLKSAEGEIKRHLSPNLHHQTLDSRPAVEEIQRSPSESAEEDGWASDDDGTRASRPTNTKSLGGKAAVSFNRRGSAKKKKNIRPSTAPQTPNISREHSRIREDRSSTPSPQRYGPSKGTGISVLRTTSWDLVSSYHPRPGSSHPDSRRGSVRNLRIESLRTAGMPGSPRELSPARSVRFADRHPPRTPPTQDPSAASSSQLGYGDKEDDSPRNGKVAFDLPSDKR